MKLLFDENLSHKLARLLEDLFPHSIHVRDVGLKAADDPLVWEYAKDNNLNSDLKGRGQHASAQLHVRPTA
jgi:predicted nuclease of predicted toxin-antitoxin system